MMQRSRPEGENNPPARIHKIAYVVSRFPTVTETFVLYEMHEMRQLGVEIEVYSLIEERGKTIQNGVEEFIDHAHYAKPSAELLRAQLYWLRTKPAKYVSLWFNTLRKNVRSLKFLSRSIAVVPMGAVFARQIEASGTTHIHAHFATHPALTAYVIHELTDIPYSLTAHAHDIYVEQAMLEEKLAKSSLIVTISDFNQRLLQKLYGESISRKVKVIHCGIDPELFQARAEKPPSSTFNIVCVGSLRDYKGQTYLVKACALLRDAKLPFECNFVGDGEDRPALEAEIRALGLEASVHILGYQKQDKVREMLNKADAFVLPSIITPTGKMEGIPVALMEALAMTIPVVTTEISGIPELVIHEQTGLLVPQRDPEALAQALIRLHDEPNLGVELGRRGRQHVLEQFDLHKNSKMLYQAVNDL